MASDKKQQNTWHLLNQIYQNLRHVHGLGRGQAAGQIWCIMRGKKPIPFETDEQESSMQKLLLAELKTSRHIIAMGETLAPRFRVWGMKGERVVIAPFEDGSTQSMMRALGNVRSYMVWVQATQFIMSGETHEPNALTATLVSKTETGAVWQTIGEAGKEFGEVEWLGASQCDPVILSMLPETNEELDEEQKQECQKLFGEGGRFEYTPTFH